MNSIFSGLMFRIEGAIAEVIALTANAGMLEFTYGSILDELRKRAGMIGKELFDIDEIRLKKCRS